MTQEEKAKRYDKLVKEVKDFFEGKQKMYSDVTQTLGHLFPELKESEDEKIRKAIISGMATIKKQGKETFATIRINDCIAWLEKQGESDETKAKTFLINKGYPIDANGILPTYEEMYNIIREGLEEQCEQKPQGKSALEAINEEKVDNANKVEPKDYNSIDPHFMKPVNETSIAVNNPDSYKIGFTDGEVYAKEQQWKPSDGQMEVLKGIIADEHVLDAYKGILKGLQEQLKKLRER